MKKAVYFVCALSLAILIGGAGSLTTCSGEGSEDAHDEAVVHEQVVTTPENSGTEQAAGQEQSLYSCPMPSDNYFSNEPGKCPKCGMELITVNKENLEKNGSK